MKTLRFILPAIFSMSLITFTSCSDDDDNMIPSTPFQEALKLKYPNASAVEWEKKQVYTVADCWVDNKDVDVWFDDNASWLMTETELLSTDLPEVITKALAQTEYANWRIDDVDLLEYPSSPKVYVIEVEEGKQEWDLYYSEQGEFLNKKDVSAIDNEHWPNEENNPNGVSTRSLYSLNETLRSMYPGVRDIEWERKGSYLVAECEMKKKDLDVWFTREGVWVKTKHELRKSEYPSTIIQAVKKDYPKWKIDDIDFIERADKNNCYLVEIEYRSYEKKVCYAENGNEEPF